MSKDFDPKLVEELDEMAQKILAEREKLTGTKQTISAEGRLIKAHNCKGPVEASKNDIWICKCGRKWRFTQSYWKEIGFNILFPKLRFYRLARAIAIFVILVLSLGPLMAAIVFHQPKLAALYFLDFFVLIGFLMYLDFRNY